jgi:hypothetical protein
MDITVVNIPGIEKTNRSRNQKILEYKKYQNKRLRFLTINSTFLYILSYLLIYIVAQSITRIVASFENISSVLYYYEIHYLKNAYNWDIFSTITVSSVTPVFGLITAFIFLTIVKKAKNIQPYTKLFFLWLIVHGFNLFIGGIISGAFTGYGLGYLIDWMFWPNMLVYLILVLTGIILLGNTGFLFKGLFLSTSPSNYYTKKNNRLKYLVFTVFIPWLTGSCILFLVKYPEQKPQHEDVMIHDTILLTTVLFILIPIAFHKISKFHHGKFRVKDKKRKIHFVIMILTIIMLIIVRVGFSAMLR